MIVDAHHHVWDLTQIPQDWVQAEGLEAINRSFLPAQYERLARAAGFGASVLVETVNVPEETPLLCAWADDSDLVSAVVGWTDLTADSVTDDLAALRGDNHGSWLRGMRHQVQGEPDPQWLARADVRRGISAVAAQNLVFELVLLPPQWSAALDLARGLPDVQFVLAHAGKPPIASGDLSGWRTWVREMAALDNVWCKLSGFVTEADWQHWTAADVAPVVEEILQAFGASRLMLGSDWPTSLPVGDFDRVVQTYRDLIDGCSVFERAAIEGGTACSVYRIPTA